LTVLGAGRVELPDDVAAVGGDRDLVEGVDVMVVGGGLAMAGSLRRSAGTRSLGGLPGGLAGLVENGSSPGR